MIDDADRALLLDTFRAEAEDLLGAMERGLLALEASPADEEIATDVFRAAHTLKASAGALGFSEAAELAHTVEDQLGRVRKKSIPASPAVVTMLLRSTDALRELIARAGAASTGSAVEAALSGTPSVTALRVDVARLDTMLDLVGEITVCRTRLARRMQRLGDVTRSVPELEELESLHRNLQQAVLEARLVPVGPWLRPLARIVRDAARATGKLAELELCGAEVEVDTRVLEQLRGPLVHMLANAVDHGIESIDERKASGKPEVGLVRLSVWTEHGGIVVELVDDGAGIDTDAVARRARALGYDPAAYPRIEELIFEPGLSTRATVTMTSGRGVGLDVVRRNVRELGGSIELASERGRGTSLLLRVPLTVAIIDGFAIGVADETYVVPLAIVERCLDAPAELSAGGADRIFDLNGITLPCVFLHRLLGAVPNASGRKSVVVVAHGARRVGLVVDALYGERQCVVKPLGRALHGVAAIAGSTIDGDGRAALILDVGALLRSAIDRAKVGANVDRPISVPNLAHREEAAS